jgi:tyrosinase
MKISIANENSAGRNYLTWAPARATIAFAEPAESPVDMVLRNADTSQGGQLEFGAARDAARAPTLSLTVPADGSEVEFFVAGEFPKASSADGDAAIEAALAGTDDALATKPVMVRIRKNADQLGPAERDRFTTALAALNNQGAGVFQSFRDMHRDPAALDQAHGAPGFLSWHRAYLLDLERELQKIDASVALPYWRFDRPAPNVFTTDFMGQTVSALGGVAFSATNLLKDWSTDSGAGIRRRPGFDVQTATPAVRDQASTLLMGGVRPNAVFDTGPGFGGFDEMEGNPHGRAHTGFIPPSWVQSPGTAPRDPVFFLLHCNVDRLWAAWQWFNDRFDGSQANTYFFQGTASQPGAVLIGHNRGDTMWPWDNDTTDPRPANAPRTPFPVVPTAPAPGAKPTVGDMIDYQGLLDPTSNLGFAYDDVPYGVAPP